MAAISQRSIASWYDNGGNVWAAHSSMELTGDHAREGRIQFNSISGGAPITSLSLRFYKNNSGGGGTFNLYATTDPNLPPNSITSGIYLGALAGWGSGTGWKTLVFTQDMMNVLSQFTGTWYLLLTCSVYVTFTGGSGSNAPEFTGTYADGTAYVNVGGVYRLGNPWANVGGVWRSGVSKVNVGGIWKDGQA